MFAIDGRVNGERERAVSNEVAKSSQKKRGVSPDYPTPTFPNHICHKPYNPHAPQPRSPTTQKPHNPQAPQPTRPHCPNPHKKTIHDDNDAEGIEIGDLMEGDTVVGIGESRVRGLRHSLTVGSSWGGI
jgi:hypothetical protein